MIGHLRDMMYGRGGEWVISFSTTEDFRELFDELADKEVDIEIKQIRKKRSLDANAYAWVLIDRIAEKVGESKSEVYRKAILELGGVSETVCVQTKNLENMKRWWSAKGLGWQAVDFPSKIEGCTNLTLYCGSSEYNTEQMSRLIDSLRQEAEAQGIPTITPEEEKRLLAQWGRK